MAFADAFSQFENLVREHLEPSVERLQVRTQDILWDLMQGSRNVQKMGRRTGTSAGVPGYEAKWEVMLQEGGLLEGAAFGETQLLKMGPDSSLSMGAMTNALHGDPTKVPLPSTIELKSVLRKIRGMYTLNYELLEAQLVSEPIENLALGTVESITSLIRDVGTSLFWGSGNGVMGLFGASPSPTTITEAGVTWFSIDKGQVFRFIRGQRYVAASLSSNVPTTPRVGNGAATTSPSVFRCVGVDPFLLKVAFQSEPGQGTITITAGDGIIQSRMWDFAAGTTLACNGVHNLLISSGTFPDSDITDTENYPELQALINGDDTSTSTYVNPEPETIDAALDLMTAFDPQTPPTLIAENNVWTLYSHLERRANMIVPVQQGGAYEANGGVSGPMYTNGGRSFLIGRSSKCRPNTIYGLDPKSFIRFMPNDMQVRWRMSNGGAAGVANIFRPVFVGTQLSDLYVAEFDTYYQLAQTRPQRNLIMKGIHSKRTYDTVA